MKERTMNYYSSIDRSNAKLIQKIIKYHDKHNLNYKEICTLFKLNEPTLQSLLSYKNKSELNKVFIEKMSEILKRKDDEINLERLDDAKRSYIKDNLYLKRINELLHIKENDGYVLTSKDLDAITRFRIENFYSRNQIVKMFPVVNNVNTLSRYERSILNLEIKNRLDDINDFFDNHKSKR